MIWFAHIGSAILAGRTGSNLPIAVDNNLVFRTICSLRSKSFLKVFVSLVSRVSYALKLGKMFVTN